MSDTTLHVVPDLVSIKVDGTDGQSPPAETVIEITLLIRVVAA